MGRVCEEEDGWKGIYIAVMIVEWKMFIEMEKEANIWGNRRNGGNVRNRRIIDMSEVGLQWQGWLKMKVFLCEIVKNSKIENTGTCKMKRLENIIQVLDVKMISNEKYYNLKDLQKCLNDLSDEMVEVEDHILTPYYVFRGKRMELYEYELTIVADTKQSFEEYLLNLTGRQSISDIPDSIVEREKNCYIECERNT